MDTNNIESVFSHQSEVSFNDLTAQTFLSVFVYLEGAVADASNPELLFPDIEKLPPDMGTVCNLTPLCQNLF